MKKKIMIVGVAALSCYLIISLYNFYDLEKSTYTTQLAEEVPLVIAHRGGSKLAPENTLEAFKKAEKIGADVIELDVHMSKDGHLVIIHDPTIDRTTNGSGRIDHFTLKQLKKYDAGYHFKNSKGQFSFRGRGVQIPTLKEVFQTLEDMPMIIEIKDQYPKKGRSKIEKKVWKLIKKYDLEKKVIVFSFHEEIMRKFNGYAKGKVAIGASKEESQRFVIFHKLNLHNLYKSPSHVFILPPERNRIRLTDKKLIKSTHRLNMMVHYWTINDEKQMKDLLKKGADGIITDRPDLLIKVIQRNKNS